MFYLGDCLEGMKELDDKSIDLVVTSPPYNLDIQYSKYKDKRPRDQWSKSTKRPTAQETVRPSEH